MCTVVKQCPSQLAWGPKSPHRSPQPVAPTVCPAVSGHGTRVQRLPHHIVFEPADLCLLQQYHANYSSPLDDRLGGNTDQDGSSCDTALSCGEMQRPGRASRAHECDGPLHSPCLTLYMQANCPCLSMLITLQHTVRMPGQLNTVRFQSGFLAQMRTGLVG